MDCFKETPRGRYQIKLTPIQLEAALEMNKFKDTGKLCLAITGKSLQKHKAEQIKAIWPFSFTVEEYEAFDYKYWYRRASIDIGSELVALLQDTAQKHIEAKFNVSDFKIPSPLLNIDHYHISTQLHDIYVTKALHRQIPQAYPFQFPELNEQVEKILYGESELEQYLENQVMKTVLEKYEAANRARRERRTEMQRLRRAEKRQKMIAATSSE